MTAIGPKIPTTGPAPTGTAGEIRPQAGSGPATLNKPAEDSGSGDGFVVNGPDQPATELGADIANGTPGAVVHSFASRNASGRARLEQDLQALQNKLEIAAKALPGVAGGAARQALSESAHRVLEALDQGRVSVAEATDAAHMLSEMTDALVAIEQGHYKIEKLQYADQPGYRAYDVRTTHGDVIRVAARTEGNESGQARLKFYNTEDDGQQVDKPHRIMVRFDLEGSELQDAPLKTSIDVQIGHEKGDLGVDRLDKRIHGILLDEQGQPVLNRLGNTVSDHHFGGDQTAPLNDREAFAGFVRSFLDRLEKGGLENP